MILSLSDYAADFDSYAAAIADARRKGGTLNKYADPTEGARLDIDDETAATVACEDISLVYVEIP